MLSQILLKGNDANLSVTLALTNRGGDAFCLNHANIFTNYDDIPKITCDLPTQNVWFDSGKSQADSYGRNLPNEFNCQLANGVTQLIIQVDDVYEAGTDSSIYVKIYQGEEYCTTNILDNRYNDFGQDSNNIYHTDKLGNCFDFTIKGTDDVSIQIRSLGADALKIKFIKFFVRSNHEMVQMKCNMPAQGIWVENGFSSRYPCRRFKLPLYANDRVSAIGMTIGAKTYRGNVWGGGGSVGPILVHLESNGKKCVTYALRRLKVSQSFKFKEDILNTCEGFMFENNEVTVYIENPKKNHDAVGVTYLQIYDYVDQTSPLINCKLPSSFWRIDGEKAGPAKCSVPNDYQLSMVKLGVCDVVHAGTDSEIRLGKH